MALPSFKELRGKAAVVTGASKGIGAAIAKRLANDGVRVILAARGKDELQDRVKEIEGAGGTAKAIVCDVRDYKSVEKAVKECVDSYSQLDIFVNNAGTIEPIARIEDSDPEIWSRAVDVNMKGVYHGLRASFPVMKKQGGGVIVNMSSGAATSALEGWSHYSSTKAAAAMLTRCGDKEMSGFGIRIIGLSPGTVATGMMRSIKDSGINPVSQLDWGVHITPEEAAHAVAYLCTKEAVGLAGADFSIKTEEGRRRIGLPV